MEINIQDDKKIVDVWLTNAEQHDESVSVRLKQLYAKYKNTGYTVVVFKSGNKDLHQETLELCQYNRIRMAIAQKYREKMAQELGVEAEMDAVVSENDPAWKELAKGQSEPHSLSS